jgi:PAS domain S-box-containing protein
MVNQGQPIPNQLDLNAKLFELQSILENIDRGFLSVDRNWCIVYANAKAASDIGKRASELVGRNLWAECPQLKGTAVAEMYRRTMEAGVAAEVEEKSVRTGCWNVHKSFPSKSGIVIAWADITERKKTEEALKQSKNKLQDILNGLDDGITLVGLDGKVLDCNQASLKLLGLTSDEFIGTNVYDIIIDEDPVRLENLLERVKAQEYGAHHSYNYGMHNYMPFFIMNHYL